MKTTVDTAGRLVVPKKIRQLAGLTPGMALDVRWKDGCIEIEPEPVPVKLARKGRLLVAVSQVDAPPLLSETVEQTRQTLQRARTSSP